MRTRVGTVVLALGTLAAVPIAVGQDAAPQASGSLVYDGDSRSRMTLRFAIGGSASAGRLQLILKQPAGAMTVAGSSPPASCTTFTAGDAPGANCDYAGGLAPGTEGTLTLQLPGDYPENGGAELRVTPVGGGAFSAPADVAGPTAAAAPPPAESKAADLRLTMEAAPVADPTVAGLDLLGQRSLRRFGVPNGVTDLVWVTVLTRVTNAGPDPAEAVQVKLDAPALPLDSGESWVVSHECPPHTFRLPGVLTPATADCGTVRASSFPEQELISRFLLWGPGTIVQHGTVTSTTRDPGPRPNEATATLDLPLLPDVKRARILPGFRSARASGAAEAAERVEVAVRTGAPRGRAVASAGCRWVKAARGGLVRDRGACDDPRWLTATGTGRWKLRLRNLRAGRYTALVRASSTGAAEAGFSTRDGNLVAFRVR